MIDKYERIFWLSLGFVIGAILILAVTKFQGDRLEIQIGSLVKIIQCNNGGKC